MSDPLTTAAGVSSGIATAAAPAAGVDYGIIFGAFIGAMFYVTQAKDIPRIRQAFSLSFPSVPVFWVPVSQGQACGVAELQRHPIRAARRTDHFGGGRQIADLHQ